MNNLLDTPLFGVTLTIGMLLLFQYLFRKTKNPLLNPLIFAIGSIIGVLLLFNIPYASYEKGGQLITFFLGPVTVCLAVPLYKHIELLKKHVVPILIGSLIGVITSLSSILVLGRVFQLNREMIASLLPKATTTAIAIDLAKEAQGDPTLTVFFVVIAGTIGYMFGEQILKLFKIKSSVAKGIGMGTAAHVFGTNRALLMSDEIGAMSSLAIGIAGLMTTLLLPLFLLFV